MKFKAGLYLSSDGLHIIEAHYSLDANGFIDILGPCRIAEEGKPDYHDFLFDLCRSDFDIIFSSWEYLGEL